jgi:hypothetical protein
MLMGFSIKDYMRSSYCLTLLKTRYPLIQAARWYPNSLCENPRRPKDHSFLITPWGGWPTFNNLCGHHSHCVGNARKIKSLAHPSLTLYMHYDTYVQ